MSQELISSRVVQPSFNFVVCRLQFGNFLTLRPVIILIVFTTTATACCRRPVFEGHLTKTTTRPRMSYHRTRTIPLAPEVMGTNGKGGYINRNSAFLAIVPARSLGFGVIGMLVYQRRKRFIKIVTPLGKPSMMECLRTEQSEEAYSTRMVDLCSITRLSLLL